MATEDVTAWRRRLDERQVLFQECLDLFDQRDTVLLQRLERLREQVGVLTGQTGQVADVVGEHKVDPKAHQ